MNLRNGLGLAVLCLAMVAGTCHAGFDEGLAAYQRKDYAVALKAWRPLAAQGNARAQFNLGVMYAKGRGVPQDDKEVVRWFRLAADQGDADAQNNLGFMYDKGQGVPQDYKEAVRWFRLAADQGHAWAQYNLGVMYVKGHGVASDRVAAYALFNLSAANDPSSDNNATANRNRLANSMSGREIEAAQALTHELAKPGNLIKALDRHASKRV